MFLGIPEFYAFHIFVLNMSKRETESGIVHTKIPTRNVNFGSIKQQLIIIT